MVEGGIGIETAAVDAIEIEIGIATQPAMLVGETTTTVIAAAVSRALALILV